MQTFYPITSLSFADQAKVLDNKRLNKQALEAWQILMNLLELDPAGNSRVSKGWRNHPAVKMWRGHELALHDYILAMVAEWHSRGYNSTIGDKAIATLNATDKSLLNPSVPLWIADQEQLDKLTSTHRLALLVKDYEWYSQFGWAEDTGTQPTSYDYFWPTTESHTESEEEQE